MIVPSYIPSSGGTGEIQIFRNPSTVTNLEWKTWTKPLGCSIVNILCIGGGGGGGSGFNATPGSPKGGGAGGGSSAVTRLTIPMIFLPDILYIQVGAGGLTQVAGDGLAGVLSYVAVAPSTLALDVLCVSGTTVGGGGGGAGSGAAGGIAGIEGAAATISIMPLSCLGYVDFIVGRAGAAGGAQTGAIGPPATFPTTGNMTMGGGGGGGSTSADFVGSIITATGNLSRTYLARARPAGALAPSIAASAGILLDKPFWCYPGLGGGASNTLAGGRGGPATVGSGGGGGGASGGGSGTEGLGGPGGTGIVIINCW